MKGDQEENWEGRVLASQFRILKKLGAGGMGVVYLADQIDMGRQVVIKVMHRELTVDQTAVERFRREAQAVAQLNHPNIVQVFVFAHVDDGSHYIAMEYVDGRSLAADLHGSGRFPELRSLRITDQILSALVEAHVAGIVHRDLKPDNIMLSTRQGSPDFVKVLDFGLVKLVKEVSLNDTLTMAGTVAGTPRYMSPEQSRGARVDSRSDLYSLGIILYEMLTGEHPFQVDSVLDYLIKHSTESISAPTQRFTDLKLMPRTEKLLLRSLEKNPDARFQSALEFQREVRLVLRDVPAAQREFPTPPDARTEAYSETAIPSETRERSAGRPKRGVRLILLGVLAMAVIGGGLFLGLYRSGGSGEEEANVGNKAPVRTEAEGGSKKEMKAQAAQSSDSVPEGEAAAIASEVVKRRRSIEPAARPGEVHDLPGEKANASPRASERQPAMATAGASPEVAALVPGPLRAHQAADAGGLSKPGKAGESAAAPPEKEMFDSEKTAPEMDTPLSEASPDEKPGTGGSPPAEAGPPDAIREKSIEERMAFDGLPVMEDARLMSRNQELLAYSSGMLRDEIVAFYQDWFEKRSIEAVPTGSGLLSPYPDVLISTVSILEYYEGRLAVALTLNPRIVPKIEVPEGGVYGEPLPAGVEMEIITERVVTYHTAVSVKDAIDFYRKEFSDRKGFTIMESIVNGLPTLSITATGADSTYYSIGVQGLGPTDEGGAFKTLILVMKSPY